MPLSVSWIPKSWNLLEGVKGGSALSNLRGSLSANVESARPMITVDNQGIGKTAEMISTITSEATKVKPELDRGILIGERLVLPQRAAQAQLGNSLRL